MIPLKLTLDIDKAPWEDLRGTIEQNGLGTITHVGRLPRGTEEGKSTVSVAITMADGKVYCGQTTMALWMMATGGLKGAEERQQSMGGPHGHDD